jgi:hypothetical protein
VCVRIGTSCCQSPGAGQGRACRGRDHAAGSGSCLDMLPRRSRPWAAAGMARAVAAATITSTRGFLARKEPMVTQNAGPCARRRLFPGMPGLRPGPRQSRLVHDRLEGPAGPPGVAAQGGGNARCPCQPQDGDDQVAHAGSASGPLVRGAESSHSEDTPDRTHHTGGEPAAHRQGVLVIAAEPSRRLPLFMWRSVF